MDEASLTAWLYNISSVPSSVLSGIPENSKLLIYTVCSSEIP